MQARSEAEIKPDVRAKAFKPKVWLHSLPWVVGQVLAACTLLAGAAQAQTLSPKLEVSLPNGYAVQTADDLWVQSPQGAIRWTRQWNGVEWKFNPQWESLSQSWKNLTGSNSADTTGNGMGLGLGSSSAGGAEGCWVWVDEDWQPSNETIEVGGVQQPVIENGIVKAAPMVAARTTPFNRIMGELPASGGGAGSDYPKGQRVNLDYAMLCPGSAGVGNSGMMDLEGLRRANELYLGDNGRYAFNNRSVLEKRPVRQMASSSGGGGGGGGISTGSGGGVGGSGVILGGTSGGSVVNGTGSGSTGSSSSGTSTSSSIEIQDNPKGYRWIDKGGDWIDYNTQGQVTAFGDRNNNTVWIQRDTGGRIVGVKDEQGNPILSLYYTGELLTEVRDYPAADITGDLPARSIRYEYDDRNRLVKVTDARGNTIQYGYDIANRITRVTDQEGRVTTLAYNGETVKSITAPDGGVTDYEFDYDDVHKQFISKITGPEAAAGRRVESYTHNRAGKLVSKTVNGRLEEEVRYDSGARAEAHTNARGFTTRIVRDEFERVVQLDHPDGTTQKSTYSAIHLGLTEETDELGYKTRYDYDARGNLVRQVQAAGTPEERTTEYDNDEHGQPVRMTRKGRTEANGSVTPDAVWSVEYDNWGNIRRTVDPEGFVRTYAFSRVGDLLRYTDPKGSTWSYSYDADGNVLQETDPLGQSTAYGYDKAGNLVSATDERGKTYQLAYDSHNRPTQRTDPAGGKYSSSYNQQGATASVTDASGKGMRFDYDALVRLARATDSKEQSFQIGYTDADGSETNTQRPTRVRYPTFERNLRYDSRDRLTLRNSQAGSETRIENYSYDGAGRQKTHTDANGKTRTYTYNPHGEVTEAKDPLGNTLRMVRDTRGNVIEVVDPNGQSTRMAYDRRNLLVASTDPLGHTVRYSYDANGWLATIEQANGQKVSYGYDALGRIASQREHDAQGQLRKTTSYQYDAASNLTGWSDGTYSASRSYDDADRLQSETVSHGSFGLTHAYTYHANGQTKTYTGPDGATIAYEYDGAAQLERLTIPGAGTLSVADWQWFQPKKVILPGGAEQRLEYDGYQNLTRLKVVNPAQATVFELQNKYGQLADISEASLDGAVLQYQHDDAGRLVSVIGPQGGNRSETFALDANGNRTRHSQTGSGAWSYDAAGQLASRPSAGGAGTIGYRYDASGNLIEKTDSSRQEPARTTRYGWDALNRLAEIRDGAGALIARYDYDPFDRRLKKELGDSATLTGTGSTPGQATHYLHSEWGLLAEANAAGQINIAYGWSPQRESSTAPLFARVPQAGGTWRTVYYHNDHQGTPQRITDGQGNLVWSADYDAYGKAQTRTTADAATQLTNNLRYPGQYWDAESGLHYNDRRYYDPDTGRYASSDPLGFEGGINLYTYAAAAPGRYVDPTGEFLQCLLINYGRCLLTCGIQGVAMQAIGNALSGCGDIDLLGIAKDCAKDCLWSMLPVPDPCGRFGKLFSVVVGVMGAMGGSDNANSFTGETVVHVKDANGKPALKPIAQIQIGDEVLAWDEAALIDGQLSQASPLRQAVQAKTGSSARPESASRYEKVSGVITSEVQQKLVHITLDNGKTITATQGHPFRTDEGWRDAVLLKRGGKLLLKGSGDEDSDAQAGSQRNKSAERTATIAEVHIETKTVRVFNLEVENLHTFFVGDEGYVVHNGRRGPKPQGTGPHNLLIEKIGREIVDGGGSILAGGGVRKEILIPCHGGKKSGRRPDILARDANGNRFGVNVGRTDKRGRAIPREQDALDDLNGPGKLPTTFRGYKK